MFAEIIIIIVGVEGLNTFALHIAACITVVVVLCVLVIVFVLVSGRLFACAAVAFAVVTWVVRPCAIWSVGMLRVDRRKLGTRVDGVVIAAVLC